MNREAITSEVFDALLFADRRTNSDLGLDIIANVLFGHPLPPDSLDAVNLLLRRRSPASALLRSIYGDERVDETGEPARSHDRSAADTVEGRHPAKDREVTTDDVDDALFGEGTFDEEYWLGPDRDDPAPSSGGMEGVENELLRTTLLSQTIIALHTLQALFDDTDFDDLVEDMIENLTEKREALLREAGLSR